MIRFLSKLLDNASEYFAARKGLLPLLGIVLVIINFLVRLFVPGWLSNSDLFLHVGIIVAIFGLILARAL